MIILGAVCLLSFLNHLMVYIPQLVPGNIAFINGIFDLGIFALLLYLFRTMVEPAWLKNLLYTILIAFSSVSITVYALRGIGQYSFILSMAGAMILLGAAIIALVQLIRDKQLFIFQSPMFWIAGGNICYFTMYLLTGFVIAQGKGTTIQQQEKMILLSIINDIRIGFFIAAAYCFNPIKEVDSNDRSSSLF
ncbi:hypothetical protein [Paraflavitalea sp. CAU 1676]|uniref:hypothetical protein n=1 Tax=Paraflavitalea sp. CAU 1676 TaxID=3032598 RepID=UPI0023DC3A82|nr:hypothetical protein [Paraflavitalea sp. CAU 1676]MDF2189389.1 hypothetical protein [Paraflavitalea sp. CAU 1676]